MDEARAVISSLQSSGKPPPRVQAPPLVPAPSLAPALPLAPPPLARRGGATQGAVQMRIKSAQTSTERLSQSRSMVLQDAELPPNPISRHRRNQSQHNVGGIGGLEPFVDVKGEYLNKTKISEGGKKLRKNWTPVWVVLDVPQLLFYKDSKQEALTHLKPGGDRWLLWDNERELTVYDVQGACTGTDWNQRPIGCVLRRCVQECIVRKITTNTGSEYLLQTDGSPTMCKWYDAITKTVSSLSKGDGMLSRPGLRRSNSTEYLPRHSSLPGYGSASPSSKQSNPGHRRSINMFASSKLKHSVSDSADKSGVKNRLKKFITRRPSMKTLQEKGIIKDRVFGCHLLTLCEREGTTVPNFVKLCLEAVEKRGLEADGVYRVSGNLATIQKLRFIVDQEEELDLDANQWEDVHVVTGALKMFFRELPEPLFPFRFFELFVEAIKIKDSKQKVERMKKLVNQLPKPNLDTMRVLFGHLHKILACSTKNLMSTQGISIVFGPTLMWPELDGGNMAVNMIYQNQIIEIILLESLEIFNLDK